MATSTVNHLLAHHLDQNDRVPLALSHTLSTLQASRTLYNLELEEGQHGPVMHRWQLRLTSLIASSQPSAIRAAGFQLLHATYTSSTPVLLSTGKVALMAAQSVLASPKSDSDLFCAALELVKLLLAKSTFHPEWARENVGAQAVQKTVNSLVVAASAPESEVVLPVVSSIVTLLPLYPTALRPLSPALHTLAVSLIATLSFSPSLVDAGAHLFVSLYLLAPKGRDGLREAWKTGVEALVGSIDQLTTAATNGIFSEDILFNHTLSPLALPPLSHTNEPPTPLLSLQRLESLSRVLLLLLRTPTSEKTGNVPIPVGALVELSARLSGLSTETPVKERVDPTLRTEVEALLPRLQVVGCQLSAQLSLSVGPQVALHASSMLATLARTLSTYAPRSPMRPALSTTFSIVLASLGASVDPEEGKKSLARVWRTVLEDIGSVALEPVVVAQGEGKAGGAGEQGRKAKRQKMFDPSESMAARRVALDELDLDIAERGLATLERLLHTPHAHFLPPTLQLSTSRLLLFLSLSPSFFQTHPLASTSSASFYPSTSATASGLELAKQSPRFRRNVVAALKASIESGVGADGTAERAVEVWTKGTRDHDDEISTLSHIALQNLHTVIHPALPPQQPNTSLSRQVHEAHGGTYVGDEVDYHGAAEEFRVKVSLSEKAGVDDSDDEDEEDSDDEAGGEGDMSVDEVQEALRPRKAPKKAAPAPAAPAFVPAPAASGFAAFAAPSFSAPKPVAVAVEQEEEEVSVAPEVHVEIVRATSTSTKTTVEVVKATKGADEEEDSDDDEMPAIVMGSDEE